MQAIDVDLQHMESALVDHFTTPGTGRFLAHLLGLSFAIALAGFFYRRKIFLRV
jgi:hypothetical protein